MPAFIGLILTFLLHRAREIGPKFRCRCNVATANDAALWHFRRAFEKQNARRLMRSGVYHVVPGLHNELVVMAFGQVFVVSTVDGQLLAAPTLSMDQDH